ncbi:MAG: cytochrome c oxidase subunit 3 [Saprospiraceae bacterium]|uniref:Cytochrome c oxidase subunit 3 n=1 Tax=Candidatus Opimibacter skivensis TaxID=2982028 RepID=A0A9D7XTS5_9BACT|nr:cytochrome c oxidase subunit 3 [Candidatus Opimibacter skivensis]
MTKSYHQRAYSVPPSSIIMVLILMGITALFSALSIAYLYSRIDKGMDSIRVPWLFVFNTFILASSSFCIQKCRKYFNQRDEKQILNWGLLTIGATILFLILQTIAWNHLLAQHIAPGFSGGHGYLYAISILHFLHVAAGIPFLLRILLPLYVSGKEGNSVLYFLNDDQKTRLKHTAWYWHFIDVMWIYLMIFFLVSSIV